MHLVLALTLLAGQLPPENPTAVVTALWADYADRLSHGDTEAMASFYAPDSRLMIAGADDIVGQAAVRAAIRATFGQRTRPVDTRLTPREVTGYDGVIYDRGDYIETLAAQGQPRSAVDVYGRYFAVWAQQADGSWKIARLMFSPKKQPTR